MNTGEGLHRFVDPVDDEVYLYTQFEVADSPADVRGVRAARPQGDASRSRSPPRPTGGRVQRARRPEPEPAGEADGEPALAGSPRRRGSRRYITALVAGPYHVVRDELPDRDGRTDPARRLLPQVAGRAPGRRRHLRQHHAQGFAFFEDEFDLPYPFAKYDQLFVPEFNAGAMENAGAVTFLEAYVFRVQGRRGDHRAPRADDPARAGAHVVRRPGDDALVERPVAQRVVRRVGLHHRARPRRPGGRSAWTTFGTRREDLGLPPGPARLDAPDRRRHPRPGGRRGQLRRHHLRQGRLGAQAARRLRRARAVRRGAACATSPSYAWQQHHAARPAARAGGDLRPRPVGVVRAVAGDRRGQHAAPGGRRSTTRASSPPSAIAADRGRAASRRCARTGSPSALYDLQRRPAGAHGPGRARRRRRAHRGARAGRPARSRTCCWSTTTTWPTPRSASTSARWRRPGPPAAASPTPCRARWSSAPRGT